MLPKITEKFVDDDCGRILAELLETCRDYNSLADTLRDIDENIKEIFATTVTVIGQFEEDPSTFVRGMLFMYKIYQEADKLEMERMFS